MTIKFENNIFHLYNNEISYIFKILNNNQLGHLYFGKKISHRSNYDFMVGYEDLNSLYKVKQEFPTYGTTDYSEGAYQILQENGSIVTNFEYVTHNIYPGKPKLINGILPATYVEENSEATTLEITLVDKLINTTIVLLYTIYENRPVITRSAKFINNGQQKLFLTRALSCSIDFDDDDFEMIQLSGAPMRERHIKTRKLMQGTQSISSTRGASSHQQNPFIALKRFNTDENQGEVYGFNLVYSGDFLAQVEVNEYEISRVTMGVNPFTFKWLLKKEEPFQTPEVVMVYSDKGLNGMSQAFHSLYRERLMRGVWRDKSCPILINNWEATYFNFNEDKLLKLAKTAKELGIELFVLDDGWFGTRDDGKSSLGDWYPYRKKLPNGISGLSEKIEKLGLKFGLWFEPEMVNDISDLYSKHPDWIIATPNRKKTLSYFRSQYILDFTRDDVVDYIYKVMSDIIRTSKISYIKWDMNRNFTEPFSNSLSNECQGELSYRYILGVYKLYNKLTQEFPHILFESCASGGGRFDAGLLYYAPQGWTSDNTDAIERIKIQYGTSLCYPLKSMGSHISAIPNHQIHRVTPLNTRGNVAYFGSFGFELDVNKLSDEEKQMIKEQIKFFKDIQNLIQFGEFYRLLEPFTNEKAAWMVVSKDKKEAIVGIYYRLAKAYPKIDRLRLVGLDQDKNYYIDNDENRCFKGMDLMNYGILLKNMGKNHKDNNISRKLGRDFSSHIILLKAK